jgi:indole-3-glycerol phosphate synthase
MDQPPVLYDPDIVDQLEVTTFLREVVEYSRDRVARRKQEVPLRALSALTSIQKRPLPITNALRRSNGPALVLTVKQQRLHGDALMSIDDYNPEELARLYAQLGAHALSVTTDPRYYNGELHHLTLISKEEEISIPVIRQDFIFDEYQVIEARAAGADGVQLIASMLGQQRLRNLLSLTQRLRMTAVVIVHNEAELERALELDPRLIGINNQDWHTFDIDLKVTHQLVSQVPQHIVTLSIGGIDTPQALAYVTEAGVDAVQVGSAVLRATDPSAKVKELFALVGGDPTEPQDTLE